jgi:hypothetical protein
MGKVYTLFLSFLILLVAGEAFASGKVTWDKDTIKVDGKPYGLMKRKSVNLLLYDYSISSLSGIELIYFKARVEPSRGTGGFGYGSGNDVNYDVNFIASGSYVDIDHHTGSGFAKLIVENNLIRDNAIDPESERRFVMVYHGYTPSSTPASETANNPAVVVNINNNVGNGAGNSSATPTSTNTQPAQLTPQPKSKSPVTINGNQIIRDDVVIGKFRQASTTSAYSQKSIIVTIYSEGGEKIAEATAPAENASEWSIHTISDNKNFNILYDSPNEKENLFKWFADKNYLTN